MDLFFLNKRSFWIVNIYVSNNRLDKYILWNWLALSLPQAIWLLCGNFNMIENPDNKVYCLPMCWCFGEWDA